MNTRIDETPVRRRTGVTTPPGPTPGTPPPSGGSGGAEPTGFAQFVVDLGYLLRAWKLRTTQPPQRMDLRSLGLAHDPFLAGWPFATIVGVGISTPAAVAGGTVLLLAAGGATGALVSGNQFTGFGGTAPTVTLSAGSRPIDLSLTYRLLAFSVNHNGGAGALTVTFFANAFRSYQAGTWLTMLGEVSAAANSINPMNQVGGVANAQGFAFPTPLWAPPPTDWAFQVPATAGGETFTITALLAALPTGSPAVG